MKSCINFSGEQKKYIFQKKKKTRQEVFLFCFFLKRIRVRVGVSSRDFFTKWRVGPLLEPWPRLHPQEPGTGCRAAERAQPWRPRCICSLS